MGSPEVRDMYQIINGKAVRIPGPQHEHRITVLEQTMPSVVSNPEMPISTVPIGFTTSFGVSAQSLLSPAQRIMSFMLNVPVLGIENRVFEATNGAATITFSIPSNIEEGMEIPIWVQAVDAQGNRSRIIRHTVTAVNGRIVRPTMLMPEVNANVVYNSGQGIAVSAGEFATTGMEDTHASTDWGMFRDMELTDPIVIDSTTSDLTVHTFQDQALEDGVTYYMAVRFHGTLIGASQWSEARPFSAQQAYIYAPVGKSPVNAAEAHFNADGVVCEVTGFNVFGAADAQDGADWAMYSDANCTNLVAEVVDHGSDLLTHTFTGLTLQDHHVYYWKCRQHGLRFGWSDWSVPCSFTAVAAFVEVPVLQSPVGNAEVVYNDTGLTIRTNNFTVNGGSDTHQSTDYYIATDINCNSVIVAALNSADKLSHTFTPQELRVLSDDTTYFAFARHRGRNLGESALSSGVPFRAQEAYVETPTIATPAINALAYFSLGLTVTTEPFTSVNANDTHARTNWKLCADQAGNNILAEASSETDLVSHTFMARDLAGLVDGQTYYLFAQHVGTRFGTSFWSAGRAVVAKEGYVEAASISAPAPNAEVIFNDTGVTITTSAFRCVGVQDTHVSTNYKICSDSAGNNIVAEVSDSSSGGKLSHVFMGLNLSPNVTYYAFAQHVGESLGAGVWSSGNPFIAKKGVVNAPVITKPSPNATIKFAAGVEVATADFGVTCGTDTHASTTWKLCSNSDGTGVIAEETSSTDLLGFTFNGLNLTADSTYYVFARHTGTKFGASEWSAGRPFVAQAGTIVTPTIVSPSANANVIFNDTGLTITTSAFAVDGGSDIHESTDYFVATDINGNSIVAAELQSSDKTSHTFSVLELQHLSDETTYYAFVRHNGRSLGASEKSPALPFRAKKAYLQTPSVTSPTERETVYKSDGFTARATPLSCVNSTDTATKSLWKICSDINGNISILNKEITENTNVCLFSPAEIADLTSGNEYFLFMRYAGVRFGMSEWSLVRTILVAESNTTSGGGESGSITENDDPGSILDPVDNEIDYGSLSD